MRLILLGIFLFIFFIISIPLFLMENIIGRFNHHSQVASSQIIVVVALRVLLFVCGVKRTMIGRDNVPKGLDILSSFHRKVPVIKAKKCFHLRKAALKWLKRPAVPLSLCPFPIPMQYLKTILLG